MEYKVIRNSAGRLESINEVNAVFHTHKESFNRKKNIVKFPISVE